MTAAEPAAFLVSRRLLRRVVKADRGQVFLGRLGSRITAYELSGARLAELVDPLDSEPAPVGGVWPDRVYLVERPAAEGLEETPAEVLLAVAWRRLFRVRVEAEFRRQIEAGLIDGRGLAARIERLGRTEFEEAWRVLREDGWLLPPGRDGEVYALFASHFLELSLFAPALLHATFPAVERADDVRALLGEDVDALAMLAATRPAGAAEPAVVAPAVLTDHEVDDEAAEPVPVDGAHADAVGPAVDRAIAVRARAEAERGNLVRAALLWTRLADDEIGEPGDGSRARSAARSALRGLARRLVSALALNEREVEAWTRALVPLLQRGSRGFWTPEARILYDVQRLCLDHEGELYRLEPLGWLFSRGRQPLKVPLPCLRDVLLSARLRAAVRRLPRIGLTDGDRGRLESVLRPAVRQAERQLRDGLRPAIERVLGQTWVGPANLPERVALGKLVEELLDRIVSHGQVTLGDLRDSASRSDLKLPDLSGPNGFVEGGRLLVADLALASALRGVYRPGEGYLRALQRLSMLAFATRTGRAFTLLVALPYGGAYVVLEGLQHLIALTGAHPHLTNRWSLLALGTVALGVINFVRFRAQFFLAMRTVGHMLRVLLVDWPLRVIEAPLVRRVLWSRPVRWAWHFVLKPGLAALPASWLARLGGADQDASLTTAALVFAFASLVLNTRSGRLLEDQVIEGALWFGRVLVHDLVPGLFRIVMSTFKAMLEVAERAFYAVDERLRFRGGQSRVSLVLKAVVTPVWDLVESAGRLVLNVLIEPQVNPIKHFPVVTVSHKVLLPLAPKFIAGLTPLIGAVNASFLSGTVLLVLPGAFGFLVWELQSNWRLYRANRPKTLRPALVGGHGETVLRLLRPGFHSGTLPKTYRRLRRARRRVWLLGGTPRPERAALRQREALHHTEEALRRFVERELLALLSGTPTFQSFRHEVRLGEVQLATNRVRAQLLSPRDDDERPASIDLELRRGTVAAAVPVPGWIETLDVTQRRAFDDALTGWLLKCGADWLAGPIEGGDRDGSTDGLPLEERAERHRRAVSSMTWTAWVALWEREDLGEAGMRAVLAATDPGPVSGSVPGGPG